MWGIRKLCLFSLWLQFHLEEMTMKSRKSAKNIQKLKKKKKLPRTFWRHPSLSGIRVQSQSARSSSPETAMPISKENPRRRQTHLAASGRRTSLSRPLYRWRLPRSRGRSTQRSRWRSSQPQTSSKNTGGSQFYLEVAISVTLNSI